MRHVRTDSGLQSGVVVLVARDPSAIAAILTEANIPTTVSENVLGVLWAKLVANCAYNALSAVAQLPYGKLIAVDGTRDVIRSVIDECAAVAQAAGITLPDTIVDMTFSIARDMPGQYSSTAQDLARGKPTEIDYLNCYVVTKGAQLGIAAPVNRLLQAMVRLKETR